MSSLHPLMTAVFHISVVIGIATIAAEPVPWFERTSWFKNFEVSGTISNSRVAALLELRANSQGRIRFVSGDSVPPEYFETAEYKRCQAHVEQHEELAEQAERAFKQGRIADAERFADLYTLSDSWRICAICTAPQFSNTGVEVAIVIYGYQQRYGDMRRAYGLYEFAAFAPQTNLLDSTMSLGALRAGEYPDSPLSLSGNSMNLGLGWDRAGTLGETTIRKRLIFQATLDQAVVLHRGSGWLGKIPWLKAQLLREAEAIDSLHPAIARMRWDSDPEAIRALGRERAKAVMDRISVGEPNDEVPPDLAELWYAIDREYRFTSPRRIDG